MISFIPKEKKAILHTTASHDMQKCMFSLPARSYVFFISITAGISGMFALCAEA